jgi:hypothetical protein
MEWRSFCPCDESRLVGVDDGLDTVAEAELREEESDV